MPKIQSHTVIDITPEKFLNACDSTELHEVELLLSSSRYQEKMGKTVHLNPVLLKGGGFSYCPTCCHTGSVPHSDCPTCGGTGRVKEQTCHRCGCTDDDCRQCIERTGEPCHWVAENLCSACAENAEPSKMSKLDEIVDSEGLLIEFAKHLRKTHLLHAHDVTIEGEVGFFLKNTKIESHDI